MGRFGEIDLVSRKSISSWLRMELMLKKSNAIAMDLLFKIKRININDIVLFSSVVAHKRELVLFTYFFIFKFFPVK
jgi:hypothetical protein